MAGIRDGHKNGPNFLVVGGVGHLSLSDTWRVTDSWTLCLSDTWTQRQLATIPVLKALEGFFFAFKKEKTLFLPHLWMPKMLRFLWRF